MAMFHALTRASAVFIVLALVGCQPAPAGEDATDPETPSTQPPAEESGADPDSSEDRSSDGLSAYTTVDLDACELISTDPESGARSWTCEGHAGIPLLAHDGDGRYDLDAGVQGGWAGIGPFNNLSETVEWRGPEGAPYAIIYRLRSAAPEMPNASWLIVESIGNRVEPGCVVARVDGATPNANVVAREAADRRARDFDCETDQPAGPQP